MPSFKLEIVSPLGIAYSGDADAVTAPAWDGELGILAGHAPLIAGLRHGISKVNCSDRVEYYAVDGGVIEVSLEGVMLLVRFAGKADSPVAAQALLAQHLAEAAGRATA
jgi:F-type H+-transporting ATPase subunit epsilon